MHSGRRASQVLERDHRSPAAARRQVAAACAGLPSDLVDTAMLLTSELITNAVQHGAGKIVLTVLRGEDDVRVEVCDDGGGPPPRAHACGADAEHGRGLLLLEALATAWSTSGKPGSGTRIWFSLSTG